MFPKLQMILATTLALAIVPVAGFAVSVGAAEQGNHQRGGHHRGGGQGGHHGGMMGFMGPLAKDLKLTDAQKAQMKAIAKKHRPQAGTDRKAQRQQLKTLLSAPKVDGNALRAFFNARIQEKDASAAKRAAMMTEMRAVLTAEQRAQLLKSLNTERPQQARPNQNNQNKANRPHAKFGERMVADLKLNANQQAAFNTLQAKLNAMAGNPANRQAHRQALARFIETGDATAFQATMKGAMAGKLPVNELVAFAESLDQAQRQKVLKKFERFGMGGQGRQGGRGHR
ncbi:MAG: Spy/CpxP family protein refolding chaperone [Candidatus Sericytochromatia bacterium]